MPRTAATAAAMVLAALSPALALTLTGDATVTDSDMLELEGYRIYLVGVESVEAKQTCSVDGQEWDCYTAAVRALQTIAEQGEITCEVVSGPNFLKQAIARCSIAGADIGAQYVSAGFGLTLPAETHDYDDAQKAAQEAKAGLWQSSFLPPEQWRLTQPFTAGRPAFRPVAP